MVRAFGGLVIAKDDESAAKLVTQHKLACVTLDGKISRPGSMQVSPLLHHSLYQLLSVSRPESFVVMHPSVKSIS